jgi:hypothetical protein
MCGSETLPRLYELQRSRTTLMSWAGQPGILCSPDDGLHWARACT